MKRISVLNTLLSFRNLALLGLMAVSAAQAAAPVNDTFEKALVFNGYNGGFKNQNGASATASPFDPHIGDAAPKHTLWYKIYCHLDFFGSGNYDHVTITHSAACSAVILLPAREELGAAGLEYARVVATDPVQPLEMTNPSAGTDTLSFATASFHVRPIKYFYLCVDSASTFDIGVLTGGDYNDNFIDAFALKSSKGDKIGSNLGCTDENDVPAHPGTYQPHRSVWFKWTPTFTDTAHVTTNFSSDENGVSRKTCISVFTGTTLENLQNITSDADSGVGDNSFVTFSAVAGTTYYIQVGDLDPDSPGGQFNLEWYSDSTPVQYAFAQNSADRIEETDGTTIYTVERHFATAASSVIVHSFDQTATADVDYAAIVQTLNFPARDATDASFVQTVEFTILPDNLKEDTEQMILALTVPGQPYRTFDPGIHIAISDAQPITIPGFDTTEMTVKENAGSVDLYLSRRRGKGAVSFTLNTVPLYQVGAGLSTTPVRVSFGIGQTSAVVKLPLANNNVADGNRDFRIEIAPDEQGLAVEGEDNLTVTIIDDDPIAPQPSRLLFDFGGDGVVTASITAKGVISGKLTLTDGTAIPFVNALNAAGKLSLILGPLTSPRFELSFSLESSTKNKYTVALANIAKGTSVEQSGYATSFSTPKPCPFKGIYTTNFIHAPDGLLTTKSAMASVNVAIDGTATLTGMVSDGTAFTASGITDEIGQVYAKTSAYGGKGRLSLALNLQLQQASDDQFSIGVIRPEIPTRIVTPFVQAGMLTYTAATRHYTPPSKSQRILSIWANGNGNAQLSNGGLANLVDQAIKISTTNVVTLDSPATLPSLKIILSPATGLFTGSVITSGSTKPKPIFGSLIQADATLGDTTSYGSGFFVNGATPGTVKLLGPNTP